MGLSLKSTVRKAVLPLQHCKLVVKRHAAVKEKTVGRRRSATREAAVVVVARNRRSITRSTATGAEAVTRREGIRAMRARAGAVMGRRTVKRRVSRILKPRPAMRRVLGSLTPQRSLEDRRRRLKDNLKKQVSREDEFIN